VYASDVGKASRPKALAVERLQPGANVLAKRFDRDAAKVGRIWIKPPQRGAQQRRGADDVVPPQVVERRGDLNQRLQKRFLRLLSLQPDGFPVLVRQEEFFVAVASQALGKRAATPVKRHRSDPLKLCKRFGLQYRVETRRLCIPVRHVERPNLQPGGSACRFFISLKINSTLSSFSNALNLSSSDSETMTSAVAAFSAALVRTRLFMRSIVWS